MAQCTVIMLCCGIITWILTNGMCALNVELVLLYMLCIFFSYKLSQISEEGIAQVILCNNHQQKVSFKNLITHW